MYHCMYHIGILLFYVKWSRHFMSSVAVADAHQRKLSSHYIVYTLFVSNFIGVAFARTLHYQFYSWYFHMIPFLLLSSSLANNSRHQNVHNVLRLLGALIVIVGIEVSFNVYPATPWSSLLLQVIIFIINLKSHLIFLTGLSWNHNGQHLSVARTSCL